MEPIRTQHPQLLYEAKVASVPDCIFTFQTTDLATETPPVTIRIAETRRI